MVVYLIARRAFTLRDDQVDYLLRRGDIADGLECRVYAGRLRLRRADEQRAALAAQRAVDLGEALADKPVELADRMEVQLLGQQRLGQRELGTGLDLTADVIPVSLAEEQAGSPAAARSRRTAQWSHR